MKLLSSAAPRSLSKLLQGLSDAWEVTPPATVQSFWSLLERSGPNDEVRLDFHTCLAKWDYVPDATWTLQTRASTSERRGLIYRLLGLSQSERDTCDSLFPYAPAVDAVTLIAEPSGWRPWYTAQRQQGRHFYWDAYARQLSSVRNWDPKNIAVLDESSTQVVQRLADPEDANAPPTKGLVVGYVQSGKTANFTGVIAKAADAGYRLFIVLAGTMNALRDQTQRRLDKELLGQELVGDEYKDALDWSQFVRHGGLPSHLHSFDWERLTLATEDFRSLKVGLSALTFRRVDPSKPFRAPENLHFERARLIVVKKNTTTLNHLLTALVQAATHVPFQEVPTLIIDDESDQASINTRRPTELKERTTINKLIVRLLGLFKRAQYLGYTATPFANVFIDPDDAEDLFPSDYLLSLPRPAGYMGVGDFYDTTAPIPGDYRFNQNAFVRFVEGPDDKPDNLTRALDAFVLSGAIKVYREKKGGGPFRHHTMLIHNSPRLRVHEEQAAAVRRLFERANYAGGGPGVARLETLWKSDYRPVSQTKADGAACPRTFDDLKPCIGECYRRIVSDGQAVLILNGDNSDDTPDFDRTPAWKIIVGGAKLSRGYTVEGLTVSYYRRRAGAADTLMQMGRWFGFRDGYRDLVRLYIGKAEAIDSKGNRTIDLYEAFKGVCRDEEEFRDQLRRYASLEEGQRVTPKQVPPLVPSHMLLPSARNKMYNARLQFVNYGGKEVQRTMAPTSLRDVRANIELAAELLALSVPQSMRVSLVVDKEPIDLNTLVSFLPPDAISRFVRGYRWYQGQETTMQLVLEFLEKKHGDPEIERWLLLAPQVDKPPFGYWTPPGLGAVRFGIRLRARNDENTRYLVLSEPEHISAARFLSGASDGTAKNAAAKQLLARRQGVMLLYPVLSKEEHAKAQPPTIGFVLSFPPNGIPAKVVFAVQDANRQDAVVVDAP